GDDRSDRVNAEIPVGQRLADAAEPYPHGPHPALQLILCREWIEDVTSSIYPGRTAKRKQRPSGLETETLLRSPGGGFVAIDRAERQAADGLTPSILNARSYFWMPAVSLCAAQNALPWAAV